MEDTAFIVIGAMVAFVLIVILVFMASMTAYVPIKLAVFVVAPMCLYGLFIIFRTLNKG